MKAYRAAQVIDGVSESPLERGVVVVEAGRILSVEKDGHLPAGIDVVDLGDATLLPGLIDAHVHLVWNASKEPHAVVAQESRYLTVLRAAANCMLQLRAGVTAVRDAGSTDAVAIAVAKATELGLIPGPRIVAAGHAICMTGGHSSSLGREADGPDGVRDAARSEIKAGAHFIKLMASGGIYGHAEEVGSPQLTVDEMRAAVEEAHKTGRKAAAHAYSRRAITNALDAGIDSVEHASFLDAELADRMRQAGTYIVPTLSTYQDMYDRGTELGTPDYILRKTEDVLVASRVAFTLALQTGVPIAAGTDSGAPGHPHGTLPDELRLMVGLGASPMQAIRFGTSAAADLLGIAGEVGSLRPGMRADMVAVGCDPLRDISGLKDVRLVLRDAVAVWSR
jgi:imidazolonepropionase-like amidohydrolase